MLDFKVSKTTIVCFSPGKNNDLPLIYMPHLHCKVWAVLDFTLFGKLVRFALPYM